MKATIIKENVSAARRKEIWELGKTQKFDQPVIYIVRPTEASLSIHGTDPLSKYIDESKIPVGMPIIRIDGNKNSGVVYTDENVILVRIFGQACDAINAWKAFPEIAIKVLADAGVPAKLSSHRPEANDLVIVVDGKEKKFSGSYFDLQQAYFSFFITLDFNHDVVKDLYLLNTDKFTLRNVNSISDAITGIRTINPSIDETVVDQIVAELVNRLG